jgi:hypothetical protein
LNSTRRKHAAESAGVTVQPTSGPQHAAPSEISRRTLVIIIASIGGLLVLCCAGAIHVGVFGGPPKTGAGAAMWTATALPVAPTASPTPAETPSTATESSAPSTATAICQVGANGGTFYLYLTGASADTFTGCGGGTPYAGTIDDLLSSTPGMDHRCDLGGNHAQSGAVVAVYSDTSRTNMRAARKFCDAYSGGGQG